MIDSFSGNLNIIKYRDRPVSVQFTQEFNKKHAVSNGGNSKEKLYNIYISYLLRYTHAYIELMNILTD